jgi:hypothetical protein
MNEEEDEEDSVDPLTRPALNARTLKMGLHILDEYIDLFSDVWQFYGLVYVI